MEKSINKSTQSSTPSSKNDHMNKEALSTKSKKDPKKSQKELKEPQENPTISVKATLTTPFKTPDNLLHLYNSHKPRSITFSINGKGLLIIALSENSKASVLTQISKNERIYHSTNSELYKWYFNATAVKGGYIVLASDSETNNEHLLFKRFDENQPQILYSNIHSRIWKYSQITDILVARQNQLDPRFSVYSHHNKKVLLKYRGVKRESFSSSHQYVFNYCLFGERDRKVASLTNNGFFEVFDLFERRRLCTLDLGYDCYWGQEFPYQIVACSSADPKKWIICVAISQEGGNGGRSPHHIDVLLMQELDSSEDDSGEDHHSASDYEISVLKVVQFRKDKVISTEVNTLFNLGSSAESKLTVVGCSRPSRGGELFYRFLVFDAKNNQVDWAPDHSFCATKDSEQLLLLPNEDEGGDEGGDEDEDSRFDFGEMEFPESGFWSSGEAGLALGPGSGKLYILDQECMLRHLRLSFEGEPLKW